MSDQLKRVDGRLFINNNGPERSLCVSIRRRVVGGLNRHQYSAINHVHRRPYIIPNCRYATFDIIRIDPSARCLRISPSGAFRFAIARHRAFDSSVTICRKHEQTHSPVFTQTAKPETYFKWTVEPGKKNGVRRLRKRDESPCRIY